MKYQNQDNKTTLVRTVKERCKVCYTCVRECPAKAIRVIRGQAEVIEERCIGCGNCVRVCSQGAKIVAESIDETLEVLSSGKKVAICLAPSFPVEFLDIDYRILTGMLRALGFSYVIEVAAGADVVSERYRNLLEQNNSQSIISTPCPAVVSYIEKYYPSLIGNMAAIPSPMLVTALIAREYYGSDLKIVFVGPCIAKKNEAKKYSSQILVDIVLTFKELRKLFVLKNIQPSEVIESEPDPPHPGKGMIFPVTEGLLQSANLSKNLIENNIVSSSGKKDFVVAIKEFAQNNLETKFLDILCCDGCIMGPGYSKFLPHYSRHAAVSKYVQQRLATGMQWVPEKINLDPARLVLHFENDDRRLGIPSREIISEILRRMGKLRVEDELNCRACGYETCMEHAIAIKNGFAESEMCLPYAIEKFKETAHELALSYQQLEETQHALIQSEKLASMGQLAAGIAHEINNPLGIIVLYANVLFDDCDRKSEMYEDLKMIVQQANRCKTIVGGLLNFARKNKALINAADVIELLTNGLKVVRCPPNINLKFDTAGKKLNADIDLDQMMQVFINIFTNSIEAMPEGGELEVNAEEIDGEIAITVADTGTGIKDDLKKKIFDPFFTTKQIGKGTGLGLAVSYGIIKMHQGRISVESNADPSLGPTGTTFTVTFPQRHGE